MKKWVIVGAMFLFSLSANAEIISISGKVFKEGTTEGLAGARISLKHFPSWFTRVKEGEDSTDHYNSVVCFSDANGNFHLNANTAVNVNPLISRDHGVIVRSWANGSGLMVKMSGSNTAVRIDLFRTDGRRIASKRFIGPNSGECFVPLAHSVSAIYLVKISVNKESRTFKTIPGMGIACSMISERTSATRSLDKHAASGQDSLVIIKEGYKTTFQAIQNHNVADISVPLKASQPWKPSVALEHQGGMVKILAKGHDFEMGQPNDTVRGIFYGNMFTTDFEQPVHTVSFTHDFWMDTVEVQQGEFDSLMKKTYSSYMGAGWNSSNGMGRTVAVYSVLWGDAALFCNARSKIQGLPDTAYSYTKIIGRIGNLCTLQNVTCNLSANAYRLPTEAEWEYAARGGTTTDYYWGKNLSDIHSAADTADFENYAVWYRNSYGLGRGPGYGAHETGKLKPNTYGLYDMLGNVAEWCNDWYDLYNWGQQTDPTGPATGYIQVQRGGSWGNNLSYIRVTDREFRPPDYPYFFMGFRVVKQIN
jgi:formylglycine-generating enzyme required for sulfatase activity